jgi:hypothetical protein
LVLIKLIIPEWFSIATNGLLQRRCPRCNRHHEQHPLWDVVFILILLRFNVVLRSFCVVVMSFYVVLRRFAPSYCVRTEMENKISIKILLFVKSWLEPVLLLHELVRTITKKCMVKYILQIVLKIGRKIFNFLSASFSCLVKSIQTQETIIINFALNFNRNFFSNNLKEYLTHNNWR